MILRDCLLLLIFSLIHKIYAQNFRCNELLPAADHQNLLTFEYRNPKTQKRGVVCVTMLNNRESLVMYMEEEVDSDDPKVIRRKQAVARAHRSTDSNSLYYGIIHVLKNISDNHEDIYDLDNSAFTLKFTPETGLATITMKSRLSEKEIVVIWQPRGFVHNWIMRVEIPVTCGTNIKSLKIADPIPRDPPDRQGIVCVLQNTATSFKYFSLGWRRAGLSGAPRKFINFGSLQSASTKFVNIYTGRVHALEFPSPCHNTKNIETDRLAFKDTLIISAVKSVNSPTLMIYGDLQEIWYDSSTKIDPASPPKYPLIPNSFDSDFSADIKQIYGLSR